MKFFPFFIPMLTFGFISGCSTFDDVTFNEQADKQLIQIADAKLPASGGSASMSLTSLLSIPELDALIEKALINNPNLQQALLTLKMAEQKVTVSASNQWPSLSAGVNANKSENSSSTYTGSLDVSWSADIWQQLANANQAEQASFTASTFAYQGAKDLLVANVMQAYLELIQLAQLIDVETQRGTVYKTNEDVIVHRYKKGLMSLNELDTAKSTTQSSLATLVDYQAQYQQALRNLSILTGLTENQLVYRTTFPDVIMPLHEYDGQNIGRRPDLQQAYQTILASQYQHKVAYKALLPNLTLSGNLSNTSGNLHEALFGSSAWQLLGQLSAPLFNAGKLKSEVEIAKLSAEQSYWAFQEKLLSAVNEVDNAVAQESSITKRLVFIKSALESAKRSEETYTSRYRQGTASFIDLLQIQQQTFSLQTQVVQLTYMQLNNRIKLGLALGIGS